MRRSFAGEPDILHVGALHNEIVLHGCLERRVARQFTNDMGRQSPPRPIGQAGPVEIVKGAMDHKSRLITFMHVVLVYQLIKTMFGIDISMCGFIDKRTNVVFTGPLGVGKNHLTIAVVEKLVDMGIK